MPLSIVTDDDVLRLQYVYHGPVIDLPWLPFDLRFRGRPLPEWWMLAISMVVLWQVVDVAFAFAAGIHIDHDILAIKGVWGVFHLATSWLASGQIAATVYRRSVDSDRSLPYLAHTIFDEFVRWRRSRGPVNRAVFLVSLLPWVLVNRALWWVPLPRPCVYVIAAVIVTPFARAVVAACENPASTWTRTVERAYRRGAADITLGEPRP